MIQFSWGALTMACAVIGLFLLKLWRESRDRLFVFFAIAFWILGAHWAGLAVVNPGIESRHELYFVRLAGFLVLVLGILDKNARASAVMAASEGTYVPSVPTRTASMSRGEMSAMTYMRERSVTS